eukprot:scaffold241_cov242-Pinguiococcus_pyrenoidosus.AAC.2
MVKTRVPLGHQFSRDRQTHRAVTVAEKLDGRKLRIRLVHTSDDHLGHHPIARPPADHLSTTC